ncbi:succinylglutamate desuccinylase/aspartoacylase family protein [Sediminitomix flava]|uniref:Succinylglutamate desuccinylase/Aspartoacylase catalytic domain-containing protein n=1 Tax=Sediminitomix flava TaxID=379075 RepID=A0A315Z8H2_SEDFL|nr:succinylglutamate desuccinylase/aspartoacylase family protein [Sediminitomix flava]PWJ40958.1 hypothetical protein BC781_104224 [Sediminitomix flava]
MRIKNIEIGLGEVKRIDVNIAKLPSHTPIDIPITIARGKKPGPVLLLMGGLHGDEINGIEIVRRIIEKDLHIPSKGTVICIPILNIYGFIHFTRYVPDGKDINRSFPGNKNGSLASRVAHFMMKDIIPQIDYGVDFHTGGADRTNYPQIRCMYNDSVNAELADAFCAPFTMHSAYRSKSLRQSAAKLGKKILVYEAGESSRFDEHAIQLGIDGTIRLMNHLGMSKRKVSKPKYKNQFIRKSSWIRAQVSGIFQSEVNQGDRVTKKQTVGYITDPFGDYKKSIKSPSDGFVIGLNNDPILHQGDAVMHIGVV